MLTKKQIINFLHDKAVHNKRMKVDGSFKIVFEFDDCVVTVCQIKTKWIRHIIDKGLIKGFYFWLNDETVNRNLYFESSTNLLVCCLEKLYVFNDEENIRYILDDCDHLINVLDKLYKTMFNPAEVINIFLSNFPEWGKALKEFQENITWVDFKPNNYGFRKDTKEIVFFDIICI